MSQVRVKRDRAFVVTVHPNLGEVLVVGVLDTNIVGFGNSEKMLECSIQVLFRAGDFGPGSRLADVCRRVRISEMVVGVELHSRRLDHGRLGGCCELSVAAATVVACSGPPSRKSRRMIHYFEVN